MSGRMNRVKDAIGSTLTKLRAEIEMSHRMGKIPADYSLGFTNAFIFCDHHINMRDGTPKFYDRTTSIGMLPKPVALNSGNALKDEQTFQFLQDDLILQARGVVEHTVFDDEVKTIEITDKTIVQIRALRKAMDTLERFITDQLESEEAAKAQAGQAPDAGLTSHSGSTPEAATLTQEQGHA